GAAIDEISSDKLHEIVQKNIKQIDQASWKEFCAHVFYKQINFLNDVDFNALNTFVQEHEKKAGLSGNRIVYCATAPYFYCTITQNLSKSGLVTKGTKKSSIQQSIVYEKPFGHDLKSAHEINECIAADFDESQIFRIDHYLTKELVGNIALVRFTNIVFE